MPVSSSFPIGLLNLGHSDALCELVCICVQIGRLTMSQQFGYFQKTKQQLVQVIGEANMEQLVANGI